MPDNFLIDTPTHKRWWLPDGIHQFDSIIYGDTLRWSVRRDGASVLGGCIDLTSPQWEHLSQTAQALAERKFRKKSVYEQATGRRDR